METQIDERPLRPQATLILNKMSDEARRNGGISVRLSATDISEATGISRRRVYAALRELRERGYIDVQKNTDKYGHAPNIYTIMPPGKGRMEKIEAIASALRIPRSRAAEMMARLWSVRDTAGTLNLDEFCAKAGWQGEPLAFATALIAAGVLENGRIVW